MRRDRGATVKHHFDGLLALGAILVVPSAVLLLLVVPFPVGITEIPVPHVPAHELRAVAAVTRDLAHRAEQGLPLEVRAVGSKVRSFGSAEASGNEAESINAREAAVRAAQQSVALGQAEGLLQLRAYQEGAFVRALAQWQASGDVSAELTELGGGFVSQAERGGYLVGRRTLTLSPAALRGAFKKRWNEIVGLAGPPFDVPRAEELALLGHGLSLGSGSMSRLDTMARLDPGYPIDYARGVAWYRAGNRPAAATALARHLEGPHGEAYALRARKLLRACVDDADP